MEHPVSAFILDFLLLRTHKFGISRTVQNKHIQITRTCLWAWGSDTGLDRSQFANEAQRYRHSISGCVEQKCQQPNCYYRALQENLSKLREELDTEKKQLEIDRELLRNEADQLDLQKWAARRQFVKECLEYKKVRPGKASSKTMLS